MASMSSCFDMSQMPPTPLPLSSSRSCSTVLSSYVMAFPYPRCRRAMLPDGVQPRRGRRGRARRAHPDLRAALRAGGHAHIAHRPDVRWVPRHRLRPDRGTGTAAGCRARAADEGPPRGPAPSRAPARRRRAPPVPPRPRHRPAGPVPRRRRHPRGRCHRAPRRRHRACRLRLRRVLRQRPLRRALAQGGRRASGGPGDRALGRARLPEAVAPGEPSWQRQRLHFAAYLHRLGERAGITRAAERLYKVAWVGGCSCSAPRNCAAAGGFGFWTELPPEHCGEDLAQLRVMAGPGGPGWRRQGRGTRRSPPRCPGAPSTPPSSWGPRAPVPRRRGPGAGPPSRMPVVDRSSR